jgi:thioredoxin 1
MAGNNIDNLNDDNFEAGITKDNQPVLVDFWAEWCMPCKALAPVIDDLAKEFQGKVRFAKVNVDECQQTPAQFGIKGIPTLILFKNGKKVNELVGNQPKEKIKNLLNGSL